MSINGEYQKIKLALNAYKPPWYVADTTLEHLDQILDLGKRFSESHPETGILLVSGETSFILAAIVPLSKSYEASALELVREGCSAVPGYPIEVSGTLTFAYAQIPANPDYNIFPLKLKDQCRGPIFSYLRQRGLIQDEDDDDDLPIFLDDLENTEYDENQRGTSVPDEPEPEPETPFQILFKSVPKSKEPISIAKKEPKISKEQISITKKEAPKISKESGLIHYWIVEKPEDSGVYIIIREFPGLTFDMSIDKGRLRISYQLIPPPDNFIQSLTHCFTGELLMSNTQLQAQTASYFLPLSKPLSGSSLTEVNRNSEYRIFEALYISKPKPKTAIPQQIYKPETIKTPETIETPETIKTPGLEITRIKIKKEPESLVTLEVISADVDTDMQEVERVVRSINKPGIRWEGSVVKDHVFGLKKIEIICRAHDNVSVEDICAEIQQSEDVIAGASIISFSTL